MGCNWPGQEGAAGATGLVFLGPGGDLQGLSEGSQWAYPALESWTPLKEQSSLLCPQVEETGSFGGPVGRTSHTATSQEARAEDSLPA